MEDRSDAIVHEDDLHGWALQQAELLRNGRFDNVDLDNVAEEIESLGRSQPASLQSSYRLVALHLLRRCSSRKGRAAAGW